jgi:5-methylcytosine-specific restriction endonuclease McrA
MTNFATHIRVWVGITMMASLVKVVSAARVRIPKAIREQTWIRYNGDEFSAKCKVRWCQNRVTPFNFEVGHNIPASKGGENNIDNLRPICPSCNRSMGNKYTIDEFSKLSPVSLPKMKVTRRRLPQCMRCMYCFRDDPDDEEEK